MVDFSAAKSCWKGALDSLSTARNQDSISDVDLAILEEDREMFVYVSLGNVGILTAPLGLLTCKFLLLRLITRILLTSPRSKRRL